MKPGNSSRRRFAPGHAYRGKAGVGSLTPGVITESVTQDGVTVFSVDENGIATGRGVLTKTASATLTPGEAAYDLILYDSASAGTFTFPAHTAALKHGMRFNIAQAGAGVLTLAGASGVTINSRGDLFDTAGQYAGLSAIYQEDNVWLLVGDLA